MSSDFQSSQSLVIRDIHLPYGDPDFAKKLYAITCSDGKVASVTEVTKTLPGAVNDSSLSKSSTAEVRTGGLLLPSLCHAHIHLDKCYLLDQCDPLVSGDFAEALQVTAKAKAAFPSNSEDVYARGRRLILDSIQSGVTHMRAHVEVDHTVHSVCLESAIRLKKEFSTSCGVQISVFAQDPLFTGPSPDSNPGINWELLRAAAASPEVEVVGSAPYVEPTTELAKQNILLIFDIAHEHGLHVDFHLDYNLDPSSEPLIWFVLQHLRDRLRARTWHRDQHVSIGHATRLTLWTDTEWDAFAHAVAEDDLPISLIGLPQSDMYMMGRDSASPPRSTLNPVRLAQTHGFAVSLAVNNVGNAFTPQGAPDPLSLCPLGVALFQAGTQKACETLLESVTVNARAAIGMAPARTLFPSSQALVPRVGDPADFVLLHDNTNVQSAACNPSFSRTTIKAGRVISRRESRVWHLGQSEAARE